MFLGYDRLNGRYVVHAEGKVHVVRTVTRLPNSMKWNLKALQDVRSLPWDLHRPRDEGVVFGERLKTSEDELRGRDPLQQVKMAPIYRSDLEKIGFTVPGCSKCTSMLRHPDETTSGSHSDLCRRRVYAELAKTQDGQDRLRRAYASL